MNDKCQIIRSLAPLVSCLTLNSNDAQESRGVGTRSRASSRPARWHRGGRRNQRRKRATAGAEICTGGFWTTTRPFPHADRSFGVSRRTVGRNAREAKSYENPRSATGPSNRAWDVLETCEGTSAPFTSMLTVQWSHT